MTAAAPQPGDNAWILKMVGIEKSFPGGKVLQGVTFTVMRGEVHALVGENGAGKSTLMKILSGAYRADHGIISFDGQVMASATPQDMIDRGVAVIYQEFSQAPDLTVAENIFLNRLPVNRLGMVDWQVMAKAAQGLFEKLGFDVDPRARISRLSVAQRQMVEIARAVSQSAKLIVLDEPSAVLGDKELVKLFETIRGLQAEGVSFVYISHRLKEIFEICQSATVLRDGQVVRSEPIENWDTEALIQSMVGRPLGDYFPTRQSKPGDIVLEVDGLSRKKVLHDISFSLRAGEIVGVCGLAGAGRSELLRAIAGADPIDAGTIRLRGGVVENNSARKSVKNRVGFAPEDRKTEGLFLDQSVKFNTTISHLAPLLRAGSINIAKERKAVSDFVKLLRVRTPTIDTRIGNLSGGNQQKVVLARQLNAKCDVLLLDEPTRGVDVGAKREIYEIIVNLAERDGLAVLFVSSELPEILGLCDRILVMRDGKVSVEMGREGATEEKIMTHATHH